MHCYYTGIEGRRGHIHSLRRLLQGKVSKTRGQLHWKLVLLQMQLNWPGICSARWNSIETTEPGVSPVGNTNDTVATWRGLEKVAPAFEAGKFVVAGTRASPIAEHWRLVILRISSLLRR